MRKITFGEINKSLLFIFLKSLSLVLEHFINGYTYIGCFYDLNIYKTFYNLIIKDSTKTNFKRHRIFDPFFGYLGVIIFSFFVGRKNDKIESMETINLSYTNENKTVNEIKNKDNKSSSKIFGFFMAILILWVAEENLILIYVDIFQDLDFWFFELIFISIIFSKNFIFKIYSHQILGMAISIGVGSILKAYNITLAFNNSKEDGETIYSKYPLVFFFMILYFLLIIARSYVNTQLKVFMDLKFISQRALLLLYGVVGAIMCFITGIIITYVPCSNDMKGYVCKINYEDKLYFDNMYEYMGLGKEILARLINIILNMIAFFLLKYYDTLIIKEYTPIHVIFSFPIQYICEKTFLIILTSIFFVEDLFPKDNHLPKFLTDTSGDVGAVTGFLIYLEIIELNFCGLNYNLRKNIINRGEKEYKIALGMNAKLMEEIPD